MEKKSLAFFLLYSLNIYIIEIYLTYIVLGAQQGDSLIHTHIYYFLKLFPIIGYYKILTIVSCAIQ